MIALDAFRAGLGDRYVVERELGRGGMATVYLATDTKVGRQVAIKVLHPDLSAQLGAERFRREIQIATQLAHPNILALYDSGESAGYLYYVMPFVLGESLRERLTRERQLPIEDAVRIGVQVANALDFANRHGVVHRDVKPENILLEDGNAVVADFGVARALYAAGDGTKLTQTGMAIGTPHYMSPEQALAEKNIDGRSDQYALACVIYEMLAGQPPFTGASMQQLAMRHAIDTVPPLRVQRQTVSQELEAVILRALAKAPADRWPSLKDFAQALVAPTNITWSWRSATLAMNRTSYRSPRERLVRGALAAGALAVAVGGGSIAWKQTRSARADAAESRLDPRRLAVAYFTDGSGNGALGHLADGLTESLIQQLARVDQLDVVSAEGVAPFRGRDVPRDSMAEALQAGTLVLGSVDAEGERVRVTVKLVDGESGAERDTRTFTVPANDALALRDSLARDVDYFLRENLGREIRLKRERASTTSSDAWLLVRRAERLRKDAEALAMDDSADAADRIFVRADSLLVAATRADERWTEPLVQRSWNGYRRALTGFRGGALERADVVRVLREAIAVADTSLGRDSTSSSALEVRGSARYLLHLAHLVTDPREAHLTIERAEADLVAATKRDPHNASAWTTLSHLYANKPDFASAKLAALNAYQEDAYLAKAPDILHRLYQSSYLTETFDDASDWCAEGLRRFPRDPKFVDCRLWLLTVRKTAPQALPDSAWRLVDSIDARYPHGAGELQRRTARVAAAIVLGRAGMPDSAKRVLVRLREGADEFDRDDLLMTYEAYARLTMDDRDGALDLLTRYVTAHPEHREGWRKDSAWWWRPLEGDPRYDRLMAGAGH